MRLIYDVVPNKEDITKILSENVVMLEFKKADGTIRRMKASCMPDIVAELSSEEKPEGSRTRIVPDHVVCCVDVDLGEWRSFRLDSLISIEV